MHHKKSAIGNLPEESSWPEKELEQVPNCPICGSNRCQPMHEGLMDKVFFVAAGKWRLQRCEKCRCAFLDPRPTRETIHRAYETYYTHHSARSERTDTKSLSAFRRLRRAISNGYINNRFGANRPDAFRWGHIAAIMFPRQRALLNGEFRHLPKRPCGERRLLDIGCGNGDFLVAAQGLGWSAFGIDMDFKAVREAKSQGCNAEVGTVDALEFDDAAFDAITISHVIEHVHDPIALLRRAFDLLKPGGIIYIETPNIDGEGSKYWGKNWRGLEPPRHLVLFNHQAVSRALKDAGFHDIEFYRRANVTAGIWRQSMNIARGRDPLDESGTPPNLILRKAQIATFLDLRRSEFVTLVAHKRHD